MDAVKRRKAKKRMGKAHTVPKRQPDAFVDGEKLIKKKGHGWMQAHKQTRNGRPFTPANFWT